MAVSSNKKKRNGVCVITIHKFEVVLHSHNHSKIPYNQIYVDTVYIERKQYLVFKLYNKSIARGSTQLSLSRWFIYKKWYSRLFHNISNQIYVTIFQTLSFMLSYFLFVIVCIILVLLLCYHVIHIIALLLLNCIIDDLYHLISIDDLYIIIIFFVCHYHIITSQFDSFWDVLKHQ